MKKEQKTGNCCALIVLVVFFNLQYWTGFQSQLQTFAISKIYGISVIFLWFLSLFHIMVIQYSMKHILAPFRNKGAFITSASFPKEGCYADFAEGHLFPLSSLGLWLVDAGQEPREVARVLTNQKTKLRCAREFQLLIGPNPPLPGLHWPIRCRVFKNW